MPTLTESEPSAEHEAIDPGHDGTSGDPGTARSTPDTFLPAPAPLAPKRRRAHLIIIGLLMLLSFARGVYWSVTVVVWSPIDEAQHYGYVESLATGDGIPTVGQDLLSNDEMATLKESPTSPYRSEPYQPFNNDENWGGTRHQYEAIHGPTYYALMVPVYWVGRHFGVLGALYSLRFATAALLTLVLPLTWLLARRFFPERPGVALGSVALLAVLNSLTPGTVGNDGLAMVLATLTTLLFIKACNRAGGWLWPFVAGALFGVTMVTKSTSLVIIPFVALMIIGWWWTTRPRWANVARLAIGAGVGAVVAFAPWLAWNLHAYHAATASAASGAITSGYLGSASLGISGIWTHLSAAHEGVWLSQLTQSPSYPPMWEITFAVVLVAGATAAALHRRWRDLSVLLWCASALPGAFLAMEVLVFAIFGGSGGPMGRHLIAALPPTAIMIAAGVAFVVGARFLPVVLAWFIGAVLVFDAYLGANFVRSIYQPLILSETEGPVVYQDWADRFDADRDAVVLDAGCATDKFAVGFTTDPTNPFPKSLPVTTADGQTIDASFLLDFGYMYLYTLPTPVDGPLTVALPPGSVMRSSATERSPQVSYRNGDGDPVAAVYCQQTDAHETSFEVRYPIGHPSLSSTFLFAFPLVLAGGAFLVAIGLTVRAIVSGPGPGSGSGSATEETQDAATTDQPIS